MTNQLSKMFQSSIIVLLVFQLSGCGTLFYPERRGQRGGRLDTGIVVLDGIGLLFAIIPGVIAFAVDFGNGCIYLPEGVHIDRSVKLMQFKFDPKNTSLAQIERIIKDQTGRTVYLSQDNIQFSRLNSKEDMMAHFAQASTDIQSGRLALTHVTEESND